MHDYLGKGANKDEIYNRKHQTGSCDKEKEERRVSIERSSRASVRSILPATDPTTQTTFLYPAT